MCFSYVPSSQRKRFADLKNRAIFQNRVNGPLDRKTVRAVVGDTNLNEAPLRICMPAIAGSMRGTTGRHWETPGNANRNTVGRIVHFRPLRRRPEDLSLPRPGHDTGRAVRFGPKKGLAC